MSERVFIQILILNIVTKSFLYLLSDIEEVLFQTYF